LARISFLIAGLLLTLHGITPHHHDTDSVQLSSSEIADFSDLLQDFFHYNLGEAHLEHYLYPDDDLASLVITTIPALLFVHSAVFQLPVEVKQEKRMFVHWNESPPEKVLLSDSALRGPPTRA